LSPNSRALQKDIFSQLKTLNRIWQLYSKGFQNTYSKTVSYQGSTSFDWFSGVVCLCGRGLTLDCKQQSQSCFQLPMKTYTTTCCDQTQCYRTKSFNIHHQLCMFH
jgi:hypothetical protein